MLFSTRLRTTAHHFCTKTSVRKWRQWYVTAIQSQTHLPAPTLQHVHDTSGCSSQGFSWSPGNRYLNGSKLASTRLRNNHIIINPCCFNDTICSALLLSFTMTGHRGHRGIIVIRYYDLLRLLRFDTLWLMILCTLWSAMELWDRARMCNEAVAHTWMYRRCHVSSASIVDTLISGVSVPQGRFCLAELCTEEVW